MQQIRQISDLQQELSCQRKNGQKIAFVPTMGNLHAGHLSLVNEAQKHGQCIVVSIFVNPSQFNSAEDLANYPRTLEQDLTKLKALNLPNLLVFTPNTEDIYPSPKKYATSVKAAAISEYLCGASRPGHFDGVVTVITKLFNLITPDVAIFGRKDFQQLQVIKALAADLFFNVKIIGAPCVRESSGLALSSRNNLLSKEQKKLASGLYQALLKAATQIKDKAFSFDEVEACAIKWLGKQGFKVDYFKICNKQTLEDANLSDQNLLIAAAAFLGNVRLIDNIELNL